MGMERISALGFARAAAGGRGAKLGPLKSSVLEFGNWIFCFAGADNEAEWWIAVDDQDGETLVMPHAEAYLPADWRTPE
jgi:hypothetical protein